MRRLLPVFVLLLLAPAIPELLTGSTPLHTFFTPFSFLLEVGLYGAGAILIRELARERGLGWPRILLLGAAYGIIEEGLQIQSFFNIHHPGIGNLAVYGRALGVNWVWAEQLILFHAVFSITIPILVTELLFPPRRAQPWLGKRGRRVFGVIFALDVVLGTILFTAIWHKQYNYLPPLLPYLGCIALVVLLVWRALRPAAPARIPATEVMIPQAQRQPPNLWALRAFGLGSILGMYLISSILASEKSTIPAPITMLVAAGWAWFLYWRIRRWAGPRRVWDDRHTLALATGGMLLFALADIIIFGLAMHALDQLVVGLAAIVLLILFTRRINARAAQTLRAANAATDYLVPPGGIPVYATSPDQLTVAFTGDPAQPPASYPPDAPTVDLNRNHWSA